MTTDHDGMFMCTAGSQPVPEQSRCSSGRYRIMTMAHIIISTLYISFFLFSQFTTQGQLIYAKTDFNIAHVHEFNMSNDS